jgi:hypothetical protein
MLGGSGGARNWNNQWFTSRSISNRNIFLMDKYYENIIPIFWEDIFFLFF